MSTRSTTHFKWAADEDSRAIVYRHPDGYPEGHGRFLAEFLDDLAENVPDPRFGDPSYLAAKLVVALAREFNVDYSFDSGESARTPREHPLDFLSVGVMMEDPGDIEYRYEVICGHTDPTGRPLVLVYERIGAWDKPDWKLLGPLTEVLDGRTSAQSGV